MGITNTRLLRPLTLILLVVFIGSCVPTKNIPEGEYLLNRNRISVEDAQVKSHELRSYVRQEPNRRILGFYRFHLNVYQLTGGDTRIGNWLRRTIGEPPAIYDPVLAEITARQFEMFMQNKGYFDAEVTTNVNLAGKRANIQYKITGNQPHTVRNILYNIVDEDLASFVYADTTNALIAAGQNYDADRLQNERQRLTRHLKNEGYFHFSRDHVFFKVHDTLQTKQVDIELLISNPRRPQTGSVNDLESVKHNRYRISSISIYPEYSRLLPDQHFADTTFFRLSNGDNNPTYAFLHNGPMAIRPRTIANNILLEQDKYFSLGQLELTHAYLAGLRNFRFVNIQFSEAEPSADYLKTDGLLDMRIELTRAPTNAFTIEAEGLNSSGNLGVASSLLFQNRNLFRGAEILNIRLKGALEMSGESNAQEVFQRLPFNTVEMGAEVSVDIPKLLFPLRMDRVSRTARPQSTVLAGINYRQRPDYTRYILNLSYGVQWSQDSRKRHQLTPLEISSIKILNDSILQSRIPDANPLILSRYKDHLIGGLKYSYVYSTQQLDSRNNFIYFRGNLETAGNMMFLAANQFNTRVGEDQSHTIFGIPFAQYVKADADFRYYRVFDEDNSLVFRIMGGAGIPYGNMDVMPFIKSYYGGGANGVRAWSIYNLGPGGYPQSDELRFDKYGDIKLEANVEYRFPIYRFWKGALFMDAGNVWFLKENKQFPGGEFKPEHFMREIALGAGAGLRLDFNFFLVRLDAAFPVRNPAEEQGNRWIEEWPGFGQWNFNLGIGYPF